jgi:PAS domain S-box-containing protein
MPIKGRRRMASVATLHGRQSLEAAAAYAKPWSEWLEIVPVPIWMINAQGMLWFGNHAWHRMTAAERFPARQSGMGWLQAVHKDDQKETLTAFRSAAAERRRLDVELRMRGKGDWRSWSFQGAPYCDTTGEVLVFVGAAHDTSVALEADARLRDLSAKLVATQEAERTRIARELHDDLAQRVALLAAKLGIAGGRRPFAAKTVRQDIAAAREILRELAVGIHVLSHELHPAKLTILGLSPTIRSLCQEVSDVCRTPIHVTADDDAIHVADETALAVYRVTQEALQNAAKHSGASRIDVVLVAEPSQLTLRVADDGCGFDPAASEGTGIGLLTMRERVELVRGHLRIVSERGSGTLVEAVVPNSSSTPGIAANTQTRN